MDNLFLLLVFLAGFTALLGLGALASDTLERYRIRRRIRSITSYGETSGETSGE